jgi:O-antigen ligase
LIRTAIQPGLQRQKLLKLLLVMLALGVGTAMATYLTFDYMGGYSKRGLAMGIFFALWPVALYVAIKRPFIFPFSLFVLLVPFDNLLSLGGSYGTVTKLVAIVSGLAFIFWMVRNRRYIAPSKVVLAWLALLVWMALTVVWSIDSHAALSELGTYLQLIVLYLAISIMPLTLGEFKAFVAAIIGGSLLAALYSIYQYHSGGGVYAQIHAAELIVRVRVQAGEASIDPNAFAAALIMPMALVTVWFLQRRWSLQKFILAGMFLTLLVGIYVSGSRGALVAAGVMLLYLLFRSGHKLQMLFFSLLGLGMSFLLPTSPWHRFSNAAKTGGAGRISIWKVAWDAFKHHWLAGSGVGNFPTAYDQSFIRVYQSIYAHWHRAPHNAYIAIAVELGIIGLSLLLIACYGQLRMLGFVTKSNPMYGFRIALESAAVGLGVDALFLGILTLKFTWLLFWLMAATRTVALTRTGGQHAPPPRPPIVLASDPGPNSEPLLKVPTNA